jgi:hypothetical protein
MSSAPPFSGYRPYLAMPVIAPRPDGFAGTPDDYYQQLQIDVALTASGPGGEFVDIALSAATGSTLGIDPTLFAMTGGFISCFPAGASIPSPDNLVDPNRDTLILTVWLGDIEAQQRKFPPGTSPLGRVYYAGIDPTGTAAILRTETAKMSDAALRASWKAQQTTTVSGVDREALIDAHNSRVMSGTGSVFVNGGTPIGTIRPVAGASDPTYAFTLRATDAGPSPAYVSPLPVLIGAPYYGL